MPFNTRIFAHRGMAPMLKVRQVQFSSDSVYQLIQPYEWSQVISVSSTPVSSSSVADVNSGAAVTLLRVEVPDGQAVRYEINPPGRTTAAGNASPILTGFNQFEFRSGYTISLVDAASFP
jgi:hypothetical protein